MIRISSEGHLCVTFYYKNLWAWLSIIFSYIFGKKTESIHCHSKRQYNKLVTLITNIIGSQRYGVDCDSSRLWLETGLVN